MPEQGTGADEQTPLVQPTSNESNLRWWCKIMIFPAMLFVLGTVILTLTEQWPLLTSAYVVTQIITTIGYGDFTVKATYSKLFVAMFCLLALTFIAYAIGILCEFLIAKQSDSIRKHLRHLEVMQGAGNERKAMERYADMNKLIAGVAPAFLFLLFGTLMFRYLEHCTCGMEKVTGCVEQDFDTCASTGGYVKNMSDAFYMSVVTLTTIGFGDFQPRTALGRSISIPWMFFGVIIFANGISSLATYFFEDHISSKLQVKDAVSSISQETFKKIDKDGNGFLDRGEFLAYVLLKYDVVQEDLLNEVFKQYDKFEGAATRRVTHATILERQKEIFAKAERKRTSQGQIP